LPIRQNDIVKLEFLAVKVFLKQVMEFPSLFHLLFPNSAISMWQLLQIIRARQEEKVLVKNFPEYADHKKKVCWFWKNLFHL